MIHYPMDEIHKIYKTKMETVKVSMVNEATVVKALIGFTLLKLRDLDYLMIAEEWENIVITQYQQIQQNQFNQQYGEEF